MNITKALPLYANQNLENWKGPLTLLAARTGFAILAQMMVTVIFVWLGNPDPFKAGTAWWAVTGTLVDVDCLILLIRFTRKIGMRLIDLVGLDRKRVEYLSTPETKP